MSLLLVATSNREPSTTTSCSALALDEQVRATSAFAGEVVQSTFPPTGVATECILLFVDSKCSGRGEAISTVAGRNHAEPPRHIALTAPTPAGTEGVRIHVPQVSEIRADATEWRHGPIAHRWWYCRRGVVACIRITCWHTLIRLYACCPTQRPGRYMPIHGHRCCRFQCASAHQPTWLLPSMHVPSDKKHALSARHASSIPSAPLPSTHAPCHPPCSCRPPSCFPQGCLQRSCYPPILIAVSTPLPAHTHPCHVAVIIVCMTIAMPLSPCHAAFIITACLAIAARSGHHPRHGPPAYPLCHAAAIAICLGRAAH